MLAVIILLNAPGGVAEAAEFFVIIYLLCFLFVFTGEIPTFA